jgi:hypothetical protein
MDLVRLLRPLELLEVPHHTELPAALFERPDTIEGYQFLQHRLYRRRAGRAEAHLDRERLPLEYPLVVTFGPEPDPQYLCGIGQRRERLIGPDAWVD